MKRLTLTRIVVFAMVIVCLVCHAGANQIDPATAIASATGFSRQVSTQEWLGPLASIALSPFFGLACLSGAATYGPEWLQQRSALMSASSPLNSPLLFWLMLGLTIATSLPRLTKVSKPLALAAEKLEMYSVVIILMAIKFVGNQSAATGPAISVGAEPMVIAGIATLPWDLLLSVAAALNIIVINTIKITIELLVWLIPVPTIDAFLELANKSMCASLMALYAFSPMLATLLNLSIFAVCCLVFMKVKRRLAYTKEIMLMPLLERLFSSTAPSPRIIRAFLSNPSHGMARLTSLKVRLHEGNNQVMMEQAGWIHRRMFQGELLVSECKTGLLADHLFVRIDQAKIGLEVRKGVLSQMLPSLATT